jgi:hypothetical protein
MNMVVDRSPLILRISGLPTSALGAFSSSSCSRELKTIQNVLAELEMARSALSDRLHDAIPGAPAPFRRVLLTARRSCFNGRQISPYRNSPSWPDLCARSGRLAETVVELEDRLAQARAGLASIYSSERNRERKHLLSLIKEGNLLRGIALASPDSVDSLHRLLEVPYEGYGRKELRLEATLARYITRAAFKLSPYSTLTRIGLAHVSSDSTCGPLHLIGGNGWEERSLLRLKRYLLEQVWELLRRHAPVRDDLQVRLNDTIEEIEPKRYRFLRPGFWDFDRERDRFIYHVASLVKVTLDGPKVNWLLRELPARHMTFGDLRRLWDGRADTAGSDIGHGTLERLERIGVLCLLPPWPAHAAQLEVDILSYLLGRPADPELRPMIDVLGHLVELLRSFSGALAPSRAVRQMETLIDELWKVTAPLGGLTAETPRSRLRTGNLYEDVFLQSTTRDGVARIPIGTVHTIQLSLPPLESLLGLFSHRHDLRLTLAAFAAERWPGRSSLGVIELFGEALPIWRSFTKFLYSSRQPGEPVGTFNPLDCEDLDQLRRLREEIWQEFPRSLEPTADGWLLRSEVLAELVRRLPESLGPPVGLCLFLQPADRDGKLWVANRVYEGTGRYGSRFSAVMNEEARSAYTTHLMARGWDATGAEILDVTCPQGDTLNVHALQTQRRLEMSNESDHLPVGRRLNLHDLTVRLHGAGTPLELVDTSGRPCCPVHLGGADSIYLPPPLWFLSTVFGPGEIHLILPPRPSRRQGEVIVVDRLTLDGIVLLRKRWIAITPLLGGNDIHRGTETEVFERIDLWRYKHGIPDRVFLIEQVHHEIRHNLYKPQYLDFTSPLLVSLLRAALRHNPESLTFEEMLPMPEIMPQDEQGRPWAIELQLDTLALRSPVAPPLISPFRRSGSGITQHEPMEAH